MVARVGSLVPCIPGGGRVENETSASELLVSLFPRLTNAYVVTRVVRYRPGGFHPVYNLVFNV